MTGAPAMTGAPPPSSAADAEAELRRLLAQITGSSQDLVSEILAFGSHPIHYIHTESLDRWIDKISRWRRAPVCPESVARAKQLLFRLLDERVVRNRGVAVSSRVWSVPIVDMLAGLRECAAGPEAAVGGSQEWKEHVLRARRVLCLGKEEVPRLDRFTSRKKQKTNKSIQGKFSSNGHLSHQSHTEWRGRVGSQESLQPTRRSKRTFSLLKLAGSHLPRPRIPVGEFFQADVPKWTEPPTKRRIVYDSEGLDDTRWLGTQTWPIEEETRKISNNMIGKGRPNSCTCSSPRSVECVRFHISASRMHLKSELGRAFFSLGFDAMGEEVSKLWTNEEEIMFHNLVKLNPPSQAKSFWRPALNYFTSKSSKDIASYYFNVCVLRRMCKQTRSASETADTDDDDDDDDDSNMTTSNDGDNDKVFYEPYTSYSQSFYYLPTSVAYTSPATCQSITRNMLEPV